MSLRLVPGSVLLVAAVGSALAIGVVGCSSDSTTGSPLESAGVGERAAPTGEPMGLLSSIPAAVAAVEAELGAPQEFFEVTANSQFTNVFVAVDDATAAIAYLYVDGVLEAPGPKQEGASGRTFVSADLDFDPALVLSGVQNDLPESRIDALSVYGNGIGAVYVVGVTSDAGGLLDVEVGPTGQVLSVDPV